MLDRPSHTQNTRLLGRLVRVPARWTKCQSPSNTNKGKRYHSLDRRDERIEAVGQVRVGVRADQAVLPPGLVRALLRVVGLRRGEDALRLVFSRVPKRDLDALDELFPRDGGERVADEGRHLGCEVRRRVGGAFSGADGGRLEAVERDVGARSGGNLGPELGPDEVSASWLVTGGDGGANELFLDMCIGEGGYMGEGQEQGLREVDDVVEPCVASQLKDRWGV